MARFAIRIDSTLAPDEAWSRVLDLRGHSAVIPFTHVTEPGPYAAGLAAGSRFVARTAWGPIGFDDPMVVDELTPPSSGGPGLARIRKEGPVIRGWVELSVAPRPGGGSRVEWVQEIAVRGVPRALGGATALVGRAAYGIALRRLLARERDTIPHT